MTRRSIWLLTVAIAAALALIVIGILSPRSAAAGWLIAFVYVSAIPLGSLVLLCIQRLTGGHWGDALRPSLEVAAAGIVPMAISFIAVLIGLPVLFPWVLGEVVVAPDVGVFYLNVPLFIVRAIVAFAGWSALALLLPAARGRRGTLFAALGLIFYAVVTSFVWIDWILSAEPPFISTSFGASVAVSQILAALAFAAFAAPGLDQRAVRDLGGLMLATALGLAYIDFMAVLVIWYGDLPEKVGWFVARGFAPWTWLAFAAFVFISVLPVLALLLERVRTSRAALRAISASILLGLAFYDGYLLAPVYGLGSLAAAVLALAVLSSALVLLAGVNWLALATRWRPA
jgi:hypothetical protein